MAKKVKVTHGAITHKGKVHAMGAVFELEDAKADRLIKIGVAEEATDKDVEKDNVEKVENGIDVDKMTVNELKQIAEQQGLEVEGTGAKGAVTKVDLIEALNKDAE